MSKKMDEKIKSLQRALQNHAKKPQDKKLQLEVYKKFHAVIDEINKLPLKYTSEEMIVVDADVRLDMKVALYLDAIEKLDKIALYDFLFQHAQLVNVMDGTGNVDVDIELNFQLYLEHVLHMKLDDIPGRTAALKERHFMLHNPDYASFLGQVHLFANLLKEDKAKNEKTDAQYAGSSQQKIDAIKKLCSLELAASKKNPANYKRAEILTKIFGICHFADKYPTPELKARAIEQLLEKNKQHLAVFAAKDAKDPILLQKILILIKQIFGLDDKSKQSFTSTVSVMRRHLAKIDKGATQGGGDAEPASSNTSSPR